MYYQLNNFTGRLIGSHGLAPYAPLETSSSRKVSSKTIPGTKQVYAEVPKSIRLKMERFQVADGVPVYLKGGPLDKVLFGLTMGLCVASLAIQIKTIYGMAYTKKA